VARATRGQRLTVDRSRGPPMGSIEIVLLLFVAATALAIVARRIGVPYPILLVLGGLGLGLTPGLPRLELEPDLVFLLFLPPILFAAGYFTSIRDFKANARPIGLLAVGLVLVTTIAVAVVLRALVPAIPWPVAVAFGAIVSPPDAVAATAIFQRLGVPRRVVTILEGESLVNDATALVAYRTAIAAALTGAFSPADAVVGFVAVAVGGVFIGVVVGRVVAWFVARVPDPVFAVVITFLAPAAAYVPAEELGVSGVLAAVAAGILLGQRGPRLMNSEVRLAGEAAWQVLLFLINGAVFILIGLQLPIVLEGLSDRSPAELAGLAVAVSAATIVVRILWVFPATYLPGRLSAAVRRRDPDPPVRSVFIISWAGMRGAVSLAAALALPHELAERDLLVFLTFCVILATLVGQGLTLPLLIRVLGIVPDRDDRHEEARLRQVAAEAAVDRIAELEREWPGHQELIDALRAQYLHRSRHLEVDGDEPRDEAELELLEHRIIRRAVIDAEREAVLRLLERGAVADDVVRRVQRDLDLEELRLEA